MNCNLMFKHLISNNLYRKRHARALIVCAFLVLTPSFLLYILWTTHTPSTWLLAVTAFSVEVIVKVNTTIQTLIIRRN